MCPIRLVGFDLDDCLFDSTGLSNKARIRGIDAMIKLGLKIEREKAVKILNEIVKEYGSNSLNHYNYFIRRLNLIKEDMDNIPLSNQYKYIAAAVMAYHKEKVNSIRLYDDVQNCLERLNDNRIKTAIISDGIPIKQYEKILRLNIDKLIDFIVISDEIGVKKPNPELFKYSLSKFGVKNKEMIYIGDRLDKDILPANLANIYSIYLHRGGKYDSNNVNMKIQKEFKPDYEIFHLDKIFDIIDELNNKER
ncbi:MAG TPA: TIGR02253 family HAD-type hydrolase [bacterium]|nr:TIGR02253 family HAD-type hydrolase [bacterium]